MEEKKLAAILSTPFVTLALIRRRSSIEPFSDARINTYGYVERKSGKYGHIDHVNSDHWKTVVIVGSEASQGCARLG